MRPLPAVPAPLSLPPLAADARAFDAVGLGEASVDLLLALERFPEPDGKAPVLDQSRLPGGQIATAMRALGRLGWRAAFAGAVGKDEAGDLLLAALAEDGVDTSVARRAAGTPTRTAVILVDRTTGTRSVLEHRDKRLNCPEGGPPEASIRDARILLADATDLTAAVAAAHVAREAGVRVVVDVDEAAGDLASPLVALADVVIASEGFVRAAGGGLVDDGLSALTERYTEASAVCVTLGRRGCQAVARGVRIAVPAFDVPCVDSTGAGDVFRAGFIAAWLGSSGEHDLHGMLRYATAAAGLSCRAAGAQGGLPTAAEVRALLDSGSVVTS